ncbi:mannose-6-phosphate isomerase [Basidiobolus meristosporus CBS 931.73]|uniref:Mannose-6-phosphate isomerase n=1 Tax=Basidiobolus meristosporus CBS 931.73 TaxID=1314790 RepID=A0A1Y1W354_9FUNG|nr:mannose-6-phosphate isomerase [Basidiobolus meristosporus CBS 931.73]|eukprot:ORX67725.1 mannose-6-phosphate isomerase [Basidiobolus meristosporus CBS 931.73]
MNPIFQLQCQTQSYEWGKLGGESKVAQYAQASPDFVVEPKKPYAELWMGTHPNAPSVALLPGQEPVSLKSLISEKVELSTEEIYRKYEGEFPFLFKVLSINKALSIQAHPDKKLAQQLFSERPDLYKDPNHKPEMAVALTPFEALCGFRPLEVIRQHLQEYPEFARLVGADLVQHFNSTLERFPDAEGEVGSLEKKNALKALFQAVMTQESQVVERELTALLARVTKESKHPEITELLVRLNSQYPGDIGCFAVLFLNYTVLQPGEAIFLQANEPHAYLSGDCIECMATSDNVVRSGLTPKFKDVQVLVKMLTYESYDIQSKIMHGEKFHQLTHSLLYDPPIEEFSVLRTELPANCKEKVPGIHGPSILIVTKGSGSVAHSGETIPLKQGQVWFISPDIEVTLSSDEEPATYYRAFVSAE